MRAIPPSLQTHLDSGVTTLCHCWRLETREGEVMGFTDHDRDLTFDGVNFEAAAGFNASEIESSLGLSVDNLEAAGALSSLHLDEARLIAGDFDNAVIDLWLVNWQQTAQRVLLRRGNLGEVTRGEHAFSAELRGLAHALNQPRGRVYQPSCDAILGDQRCAVDLDAAAFRAAGAIASVEDRRRFVLGGSGAFDAGWFARGTIEFNSGANAGRRGEIKIHRPVSAGAEIELWHPMPWAVAAGDAAVLRAGCDKQFSTCRSKFANGANFRGFPHIPGDDFVLTYVTRSSDDNDGASRNTNI